MLFCVLSTTVAVGYPRLAASRGCLYLLTCYLQIPLDTEHVMRHHIVKI